MEFKDNKPSKCKFCESESLVKSGKVITTGITHQKYLCKNCGRTFY